MHDMIHAFMHISNYKAWLKRGFNGKGPNLASLKLKVVVMWDDPKILADTTESYLGAKDVNPADYAMEESKLVGSTKQKLDLPPGIDCDFHQPNKVNYFKWNISRLPPNSTKQCWAMHAITKTLYIAKVWTSKHDTHASTYNGLEKEFHSTNNVEYG